MASTLYGRGDEKVQSAQERKRQQSRARMEDVNASAQGSKVTLAELQASRR